MGKSKTERDEVKISGVFQNTAAIPVATIKNARVFEDYYEEMQAEYDRAAEAFHATDVRSTEIVKRAAEWEEISRRMIMAHAAFFGLRRGDYEKREKALAGMKQCKDDSGIRVDNLKLHYELAAGEENPDPAYLRKVLKLKLDELKFYFRAVSTQKAYLERYTSDPDYMTPELRAEKKASAVVAEMMKKVPRDRIYLPARPFPPVRVPEGERVPYPPEAYAVWKSLPVEDMIYDAEHDEFTVPEGYVSRDGTIDDKSVVWDWKNNTVTMKFVGGEAVTWPFWKPKDTFDVLHEGDWCAEYYIRLYQQVLEDLEPPGMHD